MTVLQTARDLIKDALNATGAPVQFTKRRWAADRSLEEGEVSAAVMFHRETPVRAGGPSSNTARREHQIAVQVVTTTEDPADIDDVLEPYREWMVQQLGGNKLGGLIHDLEEGPTTWETATLERVHGAFITLWTVHYQTKKNDISLRS